MKEWEKAWEKVDLFDKWKPKSNRDHWHEKAFKEGWDAALKKMVFVLDIDSCNIDWLLAEEK